MTTTIIKIKEVDKEDKKVDEEITELRMSEDEERLQRIHEQASEEIA